MGCSASHNSSIKQKKDFRKQEDELAKYGIKCEQLIKTDQNIEHFILFGQNSEGKGSMIKFTPHNNEGEFKNVHYPFLVELGCYPQCIIDEPSGHILITGGVHRGLKKLITHNYAYNYINNKWTQIPIMNQTRYSHSSLYFQNNLYVFGGRLKSEDDGVCPTVEKIHIELQKNIYGQRQDFHMRQMENKFISHSREWSMCSSMAKKRCSHFSIGLEQQKKILLFGGYSGNRKRNKLVEIYNTLTDTWSTHTLRLLHGTERGIVIPYSNYEFLLLGGRIRSGDTKNAIKYNARDNTYIYGPQCITPRVLQKAFLTDTCVYILGGSSDNTTQTEVYRTDTNVFQPLRTNLKSLTSNISLDLKSYGYSQININLDFPAINIYCPKIIKQVFTQYELSLQSLIMPGNKMDPDRLRVAENSNLGVLLGQDVKPFLLVIDSSLGCMGMCIKEVPSQMKVFGYMGVTRLPDTAIYRSHIFIAGGLYDDAKKINKEAYLLDLNTFQVKVLPKMPQVRYNFSALYLNNKIYCIGGRQYGKKSVGIIDSCESYCLQTHVWKAIAPLHVKRCGQSCLVIHDQIWVIGGNVQSQDVAGYQRTRMIERYSVQLDQWEILGLRTVQPIEGMITYYEQQSNRLFILGGKQTTVDKPDENSYLITEYDLNQIIDACQPKLNALLETQAFYSKLLRLNVKHTNETYFITIIGKSYNYSVCGTREYLSPEMAKGQGYNTSSDYFNLGCIIFQMLEGHLPFTNNNTHNYQLVFKQKHSSTTKDFIKGLLEEDPHKRLGYKSYRQVLQHCFFKDIDFQRVQAKEYTLGLHLSLMSPMDLKYFSSQKEEQEYLYMMNTSDQLLVIDE